MKCPKCQHEFVSKMEQQHREAQRRYKASRRVGKKDRVADPPRKAPEPVQGPPPLPTKGRFDPNIGRRLTPEEEAKRALYDDLGFEPLG